MKGFNTDTAALSQSDWTGCSTTTVSPGHYVPYLACPQRSCYPLCSRPPLSHCKPVRGVYFALPWPMPIRVVRVSVPVNFRASLAKRDATINQLQRFDRHLPRKVHSLRAIRNSPEPTFSFRASKSIQVVATSHYEI